MSFQSCLLFACCWLQTLLPVHWAIYPLHPAVHFADDICLSLLCIAVSVALNFGWCYSVPEFCSNWKPVTAAVAAELLPESVSCYSTRARYPLPHTSFQASAHLPPLVSGIWYISLKWMKLLAIFHLYSLQSVLKAILPAAFVVLDCGVWERRCLHERSACTWSPNNFCSSTVTKPSFHG